MALYDLNKMRPDYLSREYRRQVATGDSLTLARLEAKQGSVTHSHRHDHEVMDSRRANHVPAFLPGQEFYDLTPRINSQLLGQNQYQLSRNRFRLIK